MPKSATLHPDRLGPYELVRHLATGGMAEVYLARRIGPHGFTKTVALKRILPQLASDPEFVSMFVDEARVCAQLSHPNLVQVFDFGEAGGELYMAMEFIDGTTCSELVRRAVALNKSIPAEVVLHIVVSVLRGLEYAHSAVDAEDVPLGLVHRDVSPGNILIARSGAVKLGDFGIARADEFERRTEEGQLKGKLGYMSPEQVTGRQLDARSDLFTLGIVLAEMLTLRPLFGTGPELDVLMSIRDANCSEFDKHSQHVPPGLITIVHKSLAREPDDRYESAAEFAEAVDDFCHRSRLGVTATKLAAWLEDAQLVMPGRASNPNQVAINIAVGREHSLPSSPAKTVRPPARKHVTQSGRPQHLARQPGGKEKEGAHPDGSTPGYRVLVGGEMIGPIAYGNLVEMFVTGEATACTRVARGREVPKMARELPELARLLGSPALAPVQALPGTTVERWELDRGQHPTKLFELGLRKATGLLVCRQQRRTKKVYLLDGAPVFTASTDRHELLGVQLVERGLVLPMEVEMALALGPRYGGRLGDGLVGLGALRPIELFRALVAQAHERVTELVSWRQGTLEFFPGIQPDTEVMLHGISLTELVARGVLRSYPDQEVEQILEPYWECDIRPASNYAETVGEFRFNCKEAIVLSTLRSEQTLDLIVRTWESKGRASRGEVLRGVFLGLSARILLTTGWPPTPFRPSVPTRKMREQET